MLKPQDIVILLKILATMTLPEAEQPELTQNKLAVYLCMSVSEVNAGIVRLTLSGLLGPVWEKSASSLGLRSLKNKKAVLLLPIITACIECLIHGVKYFFPVKMGEFTRGIPTSYAAPILAKHIISGYDPIPVWPYAEGNQKGIALEPLYPSVPESVIKYPDPLFYELLVLVDAIRSGRARERKIAIDILKEKLNDK